MDLFDDVIGQPDAVAALLAAAAAPVHAYLLVGPPGSGGRQLATGFAGHLLGGHEDADTARRVRAGSHPDVTWIERTGASIRVEEANELKRLAFRSPREGARRVLVAVDFHLLAENARGLLLKTIEEPPTSAVFVLLAETIPQDLVTIASRCVVVELMPTAEADIAALLEGRGVDPATAASLAGAAGGNLERALLLADDPSFADRLALWRSVPERLDGTGAAVAVLVDQLLASADGPTAPVKARHTAELAELDARDKAMGGRRSGRGEIEDRHKRELRRVRTDELKAGLTTLSAAYRDRLVAGRTSASAFEALRDATEAIIRNPNETLLLSNLLLKLAAA